MVEQNQFINNILVDVLRLKGINVHNCQNSMNTNANTGVKFDLTVFQKRFSEFCPVFSSENFVSEISSPFP